MHNQDLTGWNITGYGFNDDDPEFKAFSHFVEWRSPNGQEVKLFYAVEEWRQILTKHKETCKK